MGSFWQGQRNQEAVPISGIAKAAANL